MGQRTVILIDKKVPSIRHYINLHVSLYNQYICIRLDSH